ncbi:flagellar biosynthesis anti-sigma factor FlgM [Roseateles sp. GG27B]
MKIGTNLILPPPQGSEKPVVAQTDRSRTGDASTTATASVAVAAKPTPQASATIELSSTVTKLMSSGVPYEGSFDTAKVSRISQAITAGKFTINAEAIADKLISNTKEMLGRMPPH